MALASCAAAVVGPYAGAVSAGDVREIEALVSTHSEIHQKQVVYIHAVRPSCVFVESSQALGGFLRSTFRVCKRSGRWTLDEHSIQNQDEVGITE